MDIDFALVLVSLTSATGLVWAFDRIFLMPGRIESVGSFKDKSASQQSSKKNLDKAVQQLLREPLIVEYSRSFFPVLLLVLVLRSFLMEPYQIPTGSMIPTLQVGDFILVNKYHYGIRLPVIGTKLFDIDKPRNGEIMVFIPPHEDRYFIKRVIGIPGDKIKLEDKVLFVNGVKQAQTFIAQLPPENPEYLVYEEDLAGVNHLIHRDLFRDRTRQEWVVPDDHYFMMGDNRDRSSDSRMWGLVPEENIRGKAFAIWMHKPPGFRLPEFGRNGWIE
jgi:signal peptidase I